MKVLTLDAMKRILLFISCALIALSLQSCATICGGARYNAKVVVPDHPNAMITVNKEYKGMGTAVFKIQRRNADNLDITVEEVNCEPETFYFRKKSFRGWSLLGTILLDQLEGVVIDAATGAWYKPDVNEKGVTKIDYDNYLYTLNYSGKPKKEQPSAVQPSHKEGVATKPVTKTDKLRELKKLLDEGILTQEEFDKEKKKILDSD